jgi:Amt family ammonium transporter
LGAGYADFAGSGVVHAVGGITALALSLIIGPRIGKYNRDGSSNAMPGHDMVIVLTGCFILAFGWFGFNPGSTLGASGALRISTIAVDTMLAGCTGSFGSVLYMWIKYGKPDASMAGNGLLAGLVAITAPSGYVNTMGATIIGFVAGLLVCVSVEFIDRVLRVDDPVGAISVHGANGIWGVISVGLFADGTNGVKGLFYGDPTQLVAQLIGVATLLGFVFSLSYTANMVIHFIIGQRSAAADELEGLDIPEMGALCYPEFVLKPDTTHAGAAASDFKAGLQVARETA